jgi:hypothetical protein
MFVKLEKHLIPNIREELLRNGTAAPTLFGQHVCFCFLRRRDHFSVLYVDTEGQ